MLMTPKLVLFAAALAIFTAFQAKANHCLKLQSLIRNDDPAEVKRFLDSFPKEQRSAVVNCTFHKKTPLSEACTIRWDRHRRWDMANLLIQMGADPNPEIPESPLVAAIKNADFDLVTLLIHNNA